MATTTVMTPPPAASYELRGWDLTELLPEPTEEMISARLAEIETAVAAFEARRGDLRPDMQPETFLDVLRQYEALIELTAIISGYASLWFYSDTSSQEALTFRNRIRTAMTAAGNRVLFYTLWWRGLSDPEAERLLPQPEGTPGIADYIHFLRDLRRFTPFTLARSCTGSSRPRPRSSARST
jgi:oligoendopeptidase F